MEFHDVRDRAVENRAKNANGMCGNIHVLTQPADLSGTEAIMLDEPVLAYLALLHGFP